MIIIFEGPDAGGKDLIREHFEAETKFANTVTTRLFFSQMVYAKYFKRPEWNNPAKLKELEDNTKKFLLYFKPLVVYCHADTPVLEERIRRRGEKVEDQPKADTVKMIYEDLFKQFKLNDRLLTIDTSLEPPMEETVRRIVNKVAALERKR